MSDYVETFKLLSEHVTLKRTLRASSLLRFLQEASIAHTIELGYPKEKTLERGLLWVIARQSVSIKRMPSYDETITLRSWPCETMRFLFPRAYQITDEAGEVIIEGMAVWALIEEKNRKIVFPDDYGILIPDGSNGRELPFPRGLKLGDLPNKVSFVAPFSKCDINGHLSNTAYLDIAEDLIPLDYLKGHTLSEIVVDYKKEIRAGAEVELAYGPYGEGFAFNNDCFSILLKYR